MFFDLCLQILFPFLCLFVDLPFGLFFPIDSIFFFPLPAIVLLFEPFSFYFLLPVVLLDPLPVYSLPLYPLPILLFLPLPFLLFLPLPILLFPPLPILLFPVGVSARSAVLLHELPQYGFDFGHFVGVLFGGGQYFGYFAIDSHIVIPLFGGLFEVLIIHIIDVLLHKLIERVVVAAQVVRRTPHPSRILLLRRCRPLQVGVDQLDRRKTLAQRLAADVRWQWWWWR